MTSSQGGASAGAGRLVAVVVTHNRLAKLQETIAGLLGSDPAHLVAVVVVNNASDDGTDDWLAAQADPRIDVVQTGANLGGAGGFDRGMRHAMAQHAPDWLVVMDDDARPDPGALAAFHGQDRSTHEGWAAAVYYPSGQVCAMNQPWINPFWHGWGKKLETLQKGRAAFHLSQEAYTAQTLTEIDGASFVGLFLSRAAIERAGYPDPRLFIYGDDVLYTLTLSGGGGRIAFDPGLRFTHDCTTLTPGAPQVFHPLWKSYYHHRNLTLVYKRAAGLWYWPALCIFVPKWIAKARHHDNPRAYLRLLARAVRDGLWGRLNLSHAQVMALAKGQEPKG